MNGVAPEGGPSLWQGIIALGMLIINVLGALIGGTWALAWSRAKIDKKIDNVAIELERKINTDIDVTMNRFGETIAALKQKQNDDQFWNRDNFVSKATFATVLQDMRESVRRLEDKIDKLHDSIVSMLTDRGFGGK